MVAGTHGNERNAPWLIQQWRQRPELLQRQGLEVELEIGNPAAVAAQRRSAPFESAAAGISAANDKGSSSSGCIGIVAGGSRKPTR